MEKLEQIKALMEGMSKKELQSLNMAVVTAIQKAGKLERAEFVKGFPVGTPVTFTTMKKAYKGMVFTGFVTEASLKYIGVQTEKSGWWPLPLSPLIQKVG